MKVPKIKRLFKGLVADKIHGFNPNELKILKDELIKLHKLHKDFGLKSDGLYTLMSTFALKENIRYDMTRHCELLNDIEGQ